MACQYNIKVYDREVHFLVARPGYPDEHITMKRPDGNGPITLFEISELLTQIYSGTLPPGEMFIEDLRDEKTQEEALELERQHREKLAEKHGLH